MSSRQIKSDEGIQVALCSARYSIELITTRTIGYLASNGNSHMARLHVHLPQAEADCQ